eukprot:scaffold7624_cov248-Pinguiococcus_pyrenoidosus.AAC.15
MVEKRNHRDFERIGWEKWSGLRRLKLESAKRRLGSFGKFESSFKDVEPARQIPGRFVLRR